LDGRRLGVTLVVFGVMAVQEPWFVADAGSVGPYTGAVACGRCPSDAAEVWMLQDEDGLTVGVVFRCKVCGREWMQDREGEASDD
jgi:hypothetical protein